MDADAEIEKLIERFSPIIAQAILDALDRVAASIDPAVLEAAFASRDIRRIPEALGIDDSGIPDALEAEIETALDRPTLDLFGGVTAFAAVAAGFVLALDATRTRESRSVVMTAFLNDFSGATGTAVRQNINRLLKQGIDPKVATSRALIAFGLTPKQSASLNKIQTALDLALAQPKISARLIKGITAIPRRLGIDADRILGQIRGLNAAQKAALKKLLQDPNLTPAKADRFIQKQANHLRQFRTRLAGEMESRRLAETAKQTVWQRAIDNGTLPPSIRKAWATAGDERVRVIHGAVPRLNGPIPVSESFQTALGPRQHPPLEIGCRCRTVLAGAPENG